MPTSSLVTGDRKDSSAALSAALVPPPSWTPAKNRTISLESLGIAVAVLAGSLLLWPTDAGLHLSGPHVLWIAVLIVSARYGTRGFLIALPIVGGLLLVMAKTFGKIPSLVVRLDGGADVAGLLAAVLVGCVASERQRREGELAVKLDTASRRATVDQLAVHDMEDALLALRARADQLKFSLTFLRSAAERMENGDPQAAASAALEMSMARLGARGAVVQLMGGEARAVTLASAGPWTADGAPAPDLGEDRAVAAALRNRRGTRAIDLLDAGPSDADLAAPLLDDRGVTFGVIAVRGVPCGGISLAILKDLIVIAGWLSSALTRSLQLTKNHDAESVDAHLHPKPCAEMRLVGEPTLQSVNDDDRRA